MRLSWINLGIAALAGVVVASPLRAEPVAPDAVKFEDGVVTMSLTGAPGNAEEGANVFKDRKLGNCLACHVNSDQENELFHGEVGPPLDGVASRWEEGEIRAIVVNSKEVFGEETVMPGFYSLDVGKNVREDLVGQPILTAEQVEDVVAYLATLTEE